MNGADDGVETLVFGFRASGGTGLVSRVLGTDRGRVELTSQRLLVRFGPWTLRTPTSNLAGAEVTGPYRWWKVAGTPHLSLADGGITFATNVEHGVCIRFRHPVPALVPGPWFRHPAVTVTVDEPAVLAEVVQELATGEEEELVDAVEEIHDDLTGATASELRDRARALGIPGVSSMRKAELVAALEPYRAGDDAGSEGRADG